MKALSLFFVFTYRTFERMKAKSFSLLISGAFGRFGKRSVLTPPLRLSGEGRIELGSDVFVGSGCWFQTLPDGANRSTAMWIGRGTSMAGDCVISAVRHVCLEEDVLLARNVYISDHIHEYTRTNLPVQAQGVAKVRPVIIRRGAWLGQNVVVCPGVTVGRGSVIGANSVVTTDIADCAVAVGAPARVVRQLVEANNG